MRSFAVSLCLVSGLFAATGCGGSDAQCVIDTDCPVLQRCSEQQCVPIGGGVDSGTDTGARDSGADTGPVDAGMDSGTPLVGRGAVSMNQIRGAAPSYSVVAAFGPIVENPTCTETEEGPCNVRECITPPPMDAGVPDAAMPDAGPDTGVPLLPNAGDIDIRGTLVDPLTVTVVAATGAYDVLSDVVPLYNGGESLAVAAPGDTVPAIDETIDAPAVITVTAPSFLISPLVIDRSADFEITWTSVAEAPGDVRATLTGRTVPAEGGLRRVTLTCTFDGAAGTGTVPTAALQVLPADATNSRLTIIVNNSVVTTESGWETTVSASNSADTDNGNAATIATSYPSGGAGTP